ncbi:MAG: hypothetical protein ABH821_01760 [archaeon]
MKKILIVFLALALLLVTVNAFNSNQKSSSIVTDINSVTDNNRTPFNPCLKLDLALNNLNLSANQNFEVLFGTLSNNHSKQGFYVDDYNVTADSNFLGSLDLKFEDLNVLAGSSVDLNLLGETFDANNSGYVFVTVKGFFEKGTWCTLNEKAFVEVY